MSYGFRLEVWGDYALFTRPELKVERVSYDCMTPSAARGILEAILWHPGMRWQIDQIEVCNPIQFTNIRRNEVKVKLRTDQIVQAITDGKPVYIDTGREIQQRASMVLTHLRYIITAHFDMTGKASATDSPAKFAAMFERRARKGQCFHQPYFGCREFPCHFRLKDDKEVTEGCYMGQEKDLGWMLYDMDYNNKQDIQPMFFHAILKNGILDLRNCEVHR